MGVCGLKRLISHQLFDNFYLCLNFAAHEHPFYIAIVEKHQHDLGEAIDHTQ